MSKLKGKVAVVTGASKGIGAAIAKSLAGEGASVVINYSSDAQGAHKVVGDIETAGGKAVAVKADVGKSADVTHLFAETKKAFGKTDILVNNAGVFKFFPLETRRRGIPPPVQHQRAGTLLATKEAGAFRRRGRRRDQHQPSCRRTRAEQRRLCLDQGRRRHADRSTGARTGAAPHRVNSIAPGGTETRHAPWACGSDFGRNHRQDAARPPGPPDDIARWRVPRLRRFRWLTGERITASGGLR